MSKSPDKLEALFDAVVELAPTERAAYLAKACGDDEELRLRVERLLFNLERAGNFLAQDDEGPPGGTLHSALMAEKPGDRIGRYKVLEQIGEGGCGVVYMAEQEEPVRRRVALKIIKLGMDTKSVIARFEAERQALALMDHPNIAKVHDAGATESGRPYFVMELVRGIKITDYCDEKNLSTAQRLDLFIKVCQAVQHAHQKGIIHRDIKPSNILVTVNDPGSPGVPKIIDFGIAKATGDQCLTDKTVFTAFEQFIGTPAYMSPEQAELTSLDIDTRSDIYSLGVLLYELLTGKTPFDAKELLQAGLDEMRRTIREKEPPTPSTRLTELQSLGAGGAPHQSNIKDQKSKIPADLDWIVMKCLEKDRTRRYATANGLATDIQRHLNNEPVLARPPSRLYEFQKSVRRHKVGFAATAAVILALSVGVVVSSWEGVRARKAQREAVQAKADATEKLWSSYLAEARARRHSGESGQRFETLTASSNAAAIRPSLELRNEAIAAMALTDVRLLESKTKRFKYTQEFANVDLVHERYALGRTNGTISIRRLSDDSELVNLPPIENAGSLRGESFGFIPNGDLLMAGYADRRFRFWDLTLAKVVWELPFCWATFSRDSKTLAAVESNNITFYDVTRRERLKSVVPDGLASRGAYDLAGGRLAYVSDDTNVVVLDTAREKIVQKLPHPMAVFAIAWHPGGAYLAVTCEDNFIHVWDSHNGREVRTLDGHTGTPVSVNFSQDGRLLVSDGWEGRIFVWDFVSGRPLVRTLGGSTWFGTDDRNLVSCSWDMNQLDFLELGGGQEVKTIYEQARVSGAPFGTVAFSASGRWLAYDSIDGVSVFDLQAEREISSISDSPWVWGFGPDDGSVLGARWDTNGAARIFRCTIESRDYGRELAKPRVELGAISHGSPVCMSQDRKLCVAVGEDRAQVFRTDTLSEQARTDVQRGMRFAAISPDDKLLATGAWHGYGVKVWDTRSGKLLKELSPDAGSPTVVFSPDGHWLVVAEGGELLFWDTQSWSIGRRIACPVYTASTRRFSPDGKIIASASRFSNVTLFDSFTGKELAELEPPTSCYVTSLSFSPDGTQLAVAEGHRALRVWDLRAIRQQLAKMRLDWDLPPYPSPVASTPANPSP